MRRLNASAAWLFGIVLLGVVQGASGQVVDARSGRDRASLDLRGLYRIYDIHAPVFRGWMRTADASAWPLFIGAPAGAWIGARLRGERDAYAAAYRLSLSELGAFTGVAAIKLLAHRRRPYVRYDDLTSRTGDIARWDPDAFPSAHAALAFAAATSYSLSYPRWYVAGPAFAWATSVAISRVWLGVHYPSDVLVGACLGTASALVVHLARRRLTPRRWRRP